MNLNTGEVFTTNGLAGLIYAHIPAYAISSPSFQPQYVHDALPNWPNWATEANIWAPTVRIVAGKYLMFFSAQPSRLAASGSGRHPADCIGAAISNDGQYFSPMSEIQWCDPSETVGLLDPQLFVAPDGTPYLLYSRQWKTSGPTFHSEITGTKLSSDGMTRIGTPSVLLSFSDVSSYNANLGSRPYLENPALMVDPYNNFDLIASLGTWDEPGYETIEVPCLNITSSCLPGYGGVLISNADPYSPAQAPGGASMLSDGSPAGNWMVWHTGPPNARRVWAGITTAFNGNSRTSTLSSQAARSSAITSALPYQPSLPVLDSVPTCWDNRSGSTLPPLCAG